MADVSPANPTWRSRHGCLHSIFLLATRGFAGTRECVSRVPAERITTFRYGVGRGNGVGRGRGVTLGVALGVAVGVTVGVPDGVAVGVTVAVGVAVAVGVGVGVGAAAQKISIELRSGTPPLS